MAACGGCFCVTHGTATSHLTSTMADKTVLAEGSSFMDPLKGLLLTYLMPESCYDEFFLKVNFLDGECLISVEYRSLFRRVNVTVRLALAAFFISCTLHLKMTQDFGFPGTIAGG